MKLNRRHKKRFLIGSPLLFVLIGVFILPIVYAASHFSFEAESGSLQGSATAAADTSASGGSYLRFNGSTGTPNYAVPAYIESNFDTSRYYETVADTWLQSNIGEGKFRTFCRPMAQTQSVDPIVYPGQLGVSHEHTFFGNTAINESSTYQTLRTTGNSTCDGGPLNRTGYWMPTARRVSDNQIVLPEFILVYYSEDSRFTQTVQKLPRGLKMVAGWSSNTSHNQAFSWRCEAGNHTKYIVTCPANEQLIASVTFPNCWDGVNADSPDHRSHMAYIYYDNGLPTCPSTHPVRVVDISEHFFFPKGTPAVYLSSDRHGGSNYQAGSTLHADWFGAWDRDAENMWFNTCIRGDKGCNNSAVSPTQRLHNNPPAL